MINNLIRIAHVLHNAVYRKQCAVFTYRMQVSCILFTKGCIMLLNGDFLYWLQVCGR